MLVGMAVGGVCRGGLAQFRSSSERVGEIESCWMHHGMTYPGREEEGKGRETKESTNYIMSLIIARLMLAIKKRDIHYKYFNRVLAYRPYPRTQATPMVSMLDEAI